MHPKTRFEILLICLLIVLAPCTCFAKVVYVKPTGVDSNDGLSWATAKKTVTAGITASLSGDEIWVAAGVYTELITLRSGTALYGGFEGTETSRNLRNRSLNVTVLDGAQSGSVVTSPIGATLTTVIDGFTIRNGKRSSGGGVYCYKSSPTITDNIITANTVTIAGGGIYVNACSPTIAGNTITQNVASGVLDGNGGGISAHNQASPTITGNTISGNSSYLSGAGIECYESPATIVNNVIKGNRSTASSGGGVRCEMAGCLLAGNLIVENTANRVAGGVLCDGSATIVSNVIAENTAGTMGGGIYCDRYSHTIANNTIIRNTAATSGGGIHICAESAATIVNNIVAFNSSGLCGEAGSTPVLTDNCVYGNTGYDYSAVSPGTSDISLDPQFTDMPNKNYHILPSSPCLDTGNDSILQAAWMDMDGEPRTYGPHVDIGADEWALRVAPPNIEPGSGGCNSWLKAVISCATTGAVIHYTTNGADPTENDPVVTEPIPVQSEITLKARAYKDGWNPSTVTRRDYAIVPHSGLKRLGTGSPLTIYGAVVTATPSTIQFYVEADDRSCGIMAMKSGHGLSPGMRVDVRGTLAVASTGEKYVSVTSVLDRGTGTIEPLILANRAVGGGDWFYNASTGEGQKGVRDYRLLETGGGVSGTFVDATGMNNIGLLVTTFGRVTYSTTSYFYIDDGSAMKDNSAYSGVKVLGSVPKPDPLPPGWTPVGHYVMLTGISTCFKAPSPSPDLYRQIRATAVQVLD